MRNRLPTPALVETILERRVPAWHCWDGDLDSLIQCLMDYVDLTWRANRGQGLSDDGWKVNVALTCLDKLLPPDRGDFFLPFLGTENLDRMGLRNQVSGYLTCDPCPSAVRGWGRRLPESRVDDLLDIREIPENPCKFVYRSVATTWAERCPMDQPQRILQWQDHCRDHGAPPSLQNLGSRELVLEYVKRTADAETRIDQLTDAALLVVENGVSGFQYGFLDALLSELINELAEARCFPGRIALSEADLGNVDWLYSELTHIGAEDIVHAIQKLSDCFCAHIPAVRYAKHLWLKRSDWRNLYLNYRSLLSLDVLPVSYLPAIVPADETGLEVWRDILRLPLYRDMAMVYFCQWLTLKKSERRSPDMNSWQEEWWQSSARTEVLKDYFSTERDVATCAFYTYLRVMDIGAKKRLVDQIEILSFWQYCIVDRFLFAPEVLTPPTIAWPQLEIEFGDDRRADPLDLRNECLA